MKKYLLILTSVVFLTACSTPIEDTGYGYNENDANENIKVGYGNDDRTPAPEGWALLDQGDFTVYAPQGWVLTPLQGTDSYVGKVSGDDMTLTYDYGMNVGLFSGNSEFKESNYNVEELSINGFEATVYTPKVAGKGSVQVDFESPRMEGTFNMFGEDLTADQELVAVEIFKTIFFKQ